MKKARSISVKGNCSFSSTSRLERLSCTKVSPLWWSRDSLLGSLLSQRIASLWSMSSWTAMPWQDFTSQAGMDDRVLKEQLKEMEEALLRLQEVLLIQLSDILANDVSSYVEDALLSETDSISQNMLNAPVSHNHTTGWHQNSVLPGNLIIRCEYSSSHSHKLIDF